MKLLIILACLLVVFLLTYIVMLIEIATDEIEGYMYEENSFDKFLNFLL